MAELIREGMGDMPENPPLERPKTKKKGGKRKTPRHGKDGDSLDNYTGREDPVSFTGRPILNGSIFTPDVEAKLLVAAEMGLNLESCARYAGISSASIRKWREASMEGNDPRYIDLYDKLQQARTRGEFNLVETIRDQSTEDWRAAQSLLKMMHGYTEKDNKSSVNVNVDAGEASKVLVVPESLSAEDWIAQQEKKNDERDRPQIDLGKNFEKKKLSEDDSDFLFPDVE